MIDIDQFEALLKVPREEDVQSFLAAHSKILLAAFGSHWVVNECIPKLRFGAEHVSDFVIVTGQSFSYDVTLIELEPTTAHPFTKDGKYAQRLNSAISQIHDWFFWIAENEDYFRRSLARHMRDSYGARQIDSEEGRSHSKLRNPVSDVTGHRWGFVSAKIVIGRRDMFTDEDNKRRAALHSQTHKGIEIVPYDRLVDLATKLNEEESSKRPPNQAL